MAHHDRQGDLGNLPKKTKFELIDVLHRQEKLIGNTTFLKKLPDKGEKIRTFAEKLKKLIAEKEMIEQTSDLFANMKLGTSTTELDSDDDDDGEEEVAMETVKDGENVSETLPSVSVEKSTEKDNKGNNYESVMKKESVFKKRMAQQQGEKTEDVILKSTEDKPIHKVFKPNRTLRSEKIPENLKKSPAFKIKEHIERDKVKVEEESAVFPPKLKHPDGTMLLDIQESAQLEQEQQRKYEEVYAKHAAERLAEKMSVTMGDLPDIEDNVYREQISEESDSESEAEFVNED